MKVGDMVACDEWVHGGKKGIILEIQDTEYCQGAYILLNIGIKLIRLENLRKLHD